MLAGEPQFSDARQALLSRHLAGDRRHCGWSGRPSATGCRAVERPSPRCRQTASTTAVGFADALEAAQLAGISGAAQVERIRRRPRLLLGVAGLVALALIATRVALGREPPADPNRVVVYHLSVPGAGTVSAAGEQVALMIESVLEHTEPLRWLDGQALLGPDRRADARILGAEAARVARRSGARYYLDGALVSDRDSQTVIIRLHDAG
jgi:hypothetical protein